MQKKISRSATFREVLEYSKTRDIRAVDKFDGGTETIFFTDGTHIDIQIDYDLEYSEYAPGEGTTFTCTITE